MIVEGFSPQCWGHLIPFWALVQWTKNCERRRNRTPLLAERGGPVSWLSAHFRRGLFVNIVGITDASADNLNELACVV